MVRGMVGVGGIGRGYRCRDFLAGVLMPSITRRVLSYVWLLLSNTFYLLVVLYVFSRLHDRLETIVVAVLGLIYVTIRSLAIAQWIDLTARSLAFLKQFEDLRLAVIPNYETDRSEWEIAEKLLTSVHIKMFLVSIFLMLIALVCLWRLFSVL